METDFTFDLGIKPSARSGEGLLKTGLKGAAIPAARVGEALASTYAGGIIPQAAVGLTNLVGQITEGQPVLPSYEEIYSKAIPSLKSIPKAAHAVQSGISEDFLKKLGVPQEILDRYGFQEKKAQAEKYGQHLQDITPDIGPLAPPSKFREEVTKPIAGKLTEPETGFQRGLSNVSELAGFLSNPSKWTSPANALGDIIKAGGKAAVAKGAGKTGEELFGPTGGMLAELLTLSAIGLGEQKGLVNSVKEAGYDEWKNFVSSKIANEKPSNFIKGPLIKKLRNYITDLMEGGGQSDPARTLLINKAEQALEELVASPRGPILNKWRKTFNNIYNEIPKEGRDYHKKLIGIVDEGLGNWSKNIPGGSKAFNAFKNANAIHQGQFLTEKVGNLIESYVKSGKLPYAGLFFAAKPFVALQGLGVPQISKLWWKAWAEGNKGKITAMQSTLRQFDNTLGKLYPNLAQETIYGSPEQGSMETESVTQPVDFEFTL